MNRFVYFIRSVGIDDAPVKIGCSEIPERRLLQLMAWSPYRLEIVHRSIGGFSLEHRIHRRFADHRSHGEWFFWIDDVASFVTNLINGVEIEHATEWSVELSTSAGSCWTEDRTNRHSYLIRCNGAKRRLEMSTGQTLILPHDVRSILLKWGNSNATPKRPTPADLALLEAYIANPRLEVTA